MTRDANGTGAARQEIDAETLRDFAQTGDSRYILRMPYGACDAGLDHYFTAVLEMDALGVERQPFTSGSVRYVVARTHDRAVVGAIAVRMLALDSTMITAESPHDDALPDPDPAFWRGAIKWILRQYVRHVVRELRDLLPRALAIEDIPDTDAAAAGLQRVAFVSLPHGRRPYAANAWAWQQVHDLHRARSDVYAEWLARLRSEIGSDRVALIVDTKDAFRHAIGKKR